ncbi:MAG: C-terminal domain found in long catalase [Bradyrhizobium sp.]|nr:C-terminal domain found in long catalase [Bradyrhizobium sp.]
MVSGATGIAVAPAGSPEAPTPSAPTPSGPLHQDAAKLKSPALSMDKAPPPPSLIGRKMAVLLGDGVDAKEVQSALAAFAEARLVAETIGPHGGTVATSGKPMKVNRAAPNAPSVGLRRRLVPAGVGAALAAQPLAQRFVHESLSSRKADRRRAGWRSASAGSRCSAGGRGHWHRSRVENGQRSDQEPRPASFPATGLGPETLVRRRLPCATASGRRHLWTWPVSSGSWSSAQATGPARRQVPPSSACRRHGASAVGSGSRWIAVACRPPCSALRRWRSIKPSDASGSLPSMPSTIAIVISELSLVWCLMRCCRSLIDWKTLSTVGRLGLSTC